MADDGPIHYRVEFTEIGEIELDKAYLYLSTINGPESALRWFRSVQEMAASLSENPYRFVAHPSRPGARQVLVAKYHLTYRVVEPQPNEDEGIVRILNVTHASSRQSI